MSSTGDTCSAGGGTAVPAAVPAHLYVHVPLCVEKCTYCDFFSVSTLSSPSSMVEVADGLVNQALAWLERGLQARPLDTLYIGGGTPTVLGSFLPALVQRLIERFGLRAGAEVTVEANPDSLDAALATELASAGVTRVSIGVQSLDEAELRLLGRRHNAWQALAATRAVREAGMALSVDLMCGLPEQTLRSWVRTLEGAVASGAEHVSVYPLALEAGTPLAAAVLVHEIEEPDPDVAADHLLVAGEVLGAAGFERYEIANYARPGWEARHNTAYWTGREYLGVGPGAHGMLAAGTAQAAGFVAATAPGVARVRYAVACDMREGLGAMPRVDLETLNEGEAAREDVMLGLRLSAGVPEAQVEAAGVAGVLGRLGEMGLVVREQGAWRLSKRGWLLGNEVFSAVWAGE